MTLPSVLALPLLCILSLGLSACVHMQKSTAIAPSVRPHKIRLDPDLPSDLPSHSSQIADSKYVLIHAESGATNAALMLVPVPFIPDMIVQDNRDQQAKKFRNELIEVNPYQIALAEIEKSELFEQGDSTYTLHPFVFAQEGFDDMYRLSLVFHIESEEWVGRYLYHIPTTLPREHFHNPDLNDLDVFHDELDTAARELLRLIDEDALGELKPDRRTATIGSLYLVSTKILGMVSPSALHFKGAEILEEGDDYVVLRHEGDLRAQGQSGGLVFGVHYFKKSLLDLFEIEEQ